jgi:hypothetical protein
VVVDDVDGMTMQLGRPALRLLSGPAACMDRQLVYLHGVGYRSPTCRGEGVRAPGSRRVSRPTPQLELGGELARGGDLLCQAENYCARRRLVVRGGDLSEGVPL